MKPLYKNMRKKYRAEWVFIIIAVCWVVLCRASDVTAEEPEKDTRPNVMLEDIVVSAEKTTEKFQTGDVDLQISPTFYSVIPRKSFEGKIEGLSDVLKKETGVQIRSSGGMGSFSEVSLRGSSSDQVMVFLDGVLLNDASGGGVNLSNISLFDVESIEVYRGFTPINFGSASIGGAVNIKTIRTEEGLKASALAGYGSFDTYQAGAFLNHKPSRWDYLVSVDYLDSENDFEFDNDKGTPYNPADDETENRHNAQFDQMNILTKVGYELSNTSRIDVFNQYFDKAQGIPDWRNNKSTDTSLETERNITALKITLDDLGKWEINSATTLSYSWKEEEYDDSLGQIGLGRQHTIDTTRRLGGKFYADTMLGFNLLAVQLEFNHETYEPDDLITSRSPRDSSRDTFSASIQDTLLLLNERLLITPVLRYSLTRDELESSVSAYGVTLKSRDRDNSNISPQIGLKYAPFYWLTLKSNFGIYLREPSFFELFGDRGLFLGNTDLKEETGKNFDIGFEMKKHFDFNGLNSASFKAVYFSSDVDDLITRTFDARGVGKSVNIDETQVRGLETGINIEFLDHFRFIASATWQDSENLSEVSSFKHKDLPGRWEKSFLGRLEWQIGDFTAHVEYQADKNMYYDSANLLDAKDKEDISAGLKWVHNSVAVTMEGRNLQDNQYEDFNGFPMPGRSFYVTIKYFPFDDEKK